MKNIIKGGMKILGDYLSALLIFGIFLYVVLSLAREKFSFWLPYYSFLIFLLMLSIMYSDIKKLAITEKKPQYELHPHPLNGLVYGIAGFLPISLLEAIYPFIVFNDQTIKRIMHAVLNTLMGPLYFSIRIGGGTAAAYVVASLIVPVVAMLSYMAGYYGIELGKYFRKQKKDDKGKK